MIIITRERYIIKKRLTKTRINETCQFIIRAIKIINIIIFAQIYFIYNEFNFEFRRDFNKSTKFITMKIFFQNVKNNKKI